MIFWWKFHSFSDALREFGRLYDSEVLQGAYCTIFSTKSKVSIQNGKNSVELRKESQLKCEISNILLINIPSVNPQSIDSIAICIVFEQNQSEANL